MVMRLTVAEYRRNYTRTALEQLAEFAKRELGNPEIAREFDKIMQALSEEDV